MNIERGEDGAQDVDSCMLSQRKPSEKLNYHRSGQRVLCMRFRVYGFRVWGLHRV